MKGIYLLTAAAALVSSTLASDLHRHGHEAFHRRRGDYSAAGSCAADVPAADCNCITTVVTVYGEASPTTTLHSTSTTTMTVEVSPSSSVCLPTPIVTVYPTPGTYTISATTIVVTKETTVCGATTTALASGTHTYGGVTTVVTTATTVTCPIATVKPVGNTYTSVITSTTYVCPSAGTYTVAPSTTTVSYSTVMVYPTPASFTPGTYVQPAHTVTVVETDYVYVCPKPTAVMPTSAAPVSAPSYAPKPYVAQPKPPAPAPALGGGDKWGMTYTPYANDGTCKGADVVAVDIALIKSKGFLAVRVYSTDCNTLQNVGKAAKDHGLTIILGVFIGPSGIPGCQSQVNDIVQWGQWGMVDLIVVGNEALFSGKCDAGSLAGFISSAAGAFKAAGYTGPITTTEPLSVWQDKGSALCGVIDVIGCNIHPFFNGGVAAPDSGAFVKGQMELAAKVCPGKRVVNLECGWPTAGSPNGAAVPGTVQQAAAIDSIIKAVGHDTVLFSFGNDKWKNPGAFGVEQSWGCITNIPSW